VLRFDAGLTTALIDLRAVLIQFVEKIVVSGHFLDTDYTDSTDYHCSLNTRCRYRFIWRMNSSSSGVSGSA
jgi:hypothetical protein